MGLLSLLGFGQQGAPGYGGGWFGIPQQQRQQAPQAGPAPLPLPGPPTQQPLPQPPPSPLMAMPAAAPMAQPQQARRSVLGTLLGGGGGQQQTGKPGEERPPSMMSHPLTFALGGASALRGIQDQRLAQTNETRQNSLFDMQQQEFKGQQQDRQTERQRETEQLARWQAAVVAANPQDRQTLEAIGPEGYAQYQLQQRQIDFQGREGQLDRDAQVRAAQIRSANENSLGRYFQSMDAQTLGELNQQSAQLQSVGLPQLRALRGTIQNAGTSLTGQPIDYNSRITIGRLFNGSTQDRQTLEVWRAQILGPALETLRGLGAMSEREMEAAINSFSNPDMTIGAAMQLIDEKIATAERRVATAQAAGQYFRDAGGLTGTSNAAGQDWPTYLQSRIEQMPGSATTERNGVPRGGYGAPPAAAIAELRRDTSAAARREFDQTFGPGAAARALGPQRPDTGRRPDGPMRRG